MCSHVAVVVSLAQVYDNVWFKNSTIQKQEKQMGRVSPDIHRKFSVISDKHVDKI